MRRHRVEQHPLRHVRQRLPDGHRVRGRLLRHASDHRRGRGHDQRLRRGARCDARHRQRRHARLPRRRLRRGRHLRRRRGRRRRRHEPAHRLGRRRTPRLPRPGQRQRRTPRRGRGHGPHDRPDQLRLRWRRRDRRRRSCGRQRPERPVEHRRWRRRLRIRPAPRRHGPHGCARVRAAHSTRRRALPGRHHRVDGRRDQQPAVGAHDLGRAHPHDHPGHGVRRGALRRLPRGWLRQRRRRPLWPRAANHDDDGRHHVRRRRPRHAASRWRRWSRESGGGPLPSRHGRGFPLQRGRRVDGTLRSRRGLQRRSGTRTHRWRRFPRRLSADHHLGDGHHVPSPLG